LAHSSIPSSPTKSYFSQASSTRSKPSRLRRAPDAQAPPHPQVEKRQIPSFAPSGIHARTPVPRPHKRRATKRIQLTNLTHPYSPQGAPPSKNAIGIAPFNKQSIFFANFSISVLFPPKGKPSAWWPRTFLAPGTAPMLTTGPASNGQEDDRQPFNIPRGPATSVPAPQDTCAQLQAAQGAADVDPSVPAMDSLTIQIKPPPAERLINSPYRQPEITFEPHQPKSPAAAADQTWFT